MNLILLFYHRAEKKANNDLFDDEANAPLEVNPKPEEESSEEEYDDDQVTKKRKRKGKKSQALNSDDEEESKKSIKKPRKKPDNNLEIDNMFNKENKSAAPSQESSHGTQKKKLVTKTFTDQDGYTGINLSFFDA